MQQNYNYLRNPPNIWDILCKQSDQRPSAAQSNKMPLLYGGEEGDASNHTCNGDEV